MWGGLITSSGCNEMNLAVTHYAGSLITTSGCNEMSLAVTHYVGGLITPSGSNEMNLAVTHFSHIHRLHWSKWRPPSFAWWRNEISATTACRRRWRWQRHSRSRWTEHRLCTTACRLEVSLPGCYLTTQQRTGSNDMLHTSSNRADKKTHQ